MGQKLGLNTPLTKDFNI